MKRFGQSAFSILLAVWPSVALAQLGPQSTYEDVVISTQLACQADPRPPLADISLTHDLLNAKRTNGVYCLPALSAYSENKPTVSAIETAANRIVLDRPQEALDHLKSALEFSEFGLIEFAIGDIYAIDPKLHDPDQRDVWWLYARTANPALCIKQYRRYRDGDSLNAPDTAMAQMALMDGAVRGSGVCARTLVELWETDVPGYLISDEDAVLLGMLAALNGQNLRTKPLARVLDRWDELELREPVRGSARRALRVLNGAPDREAGEARLERHLFDRYDTGYIPMHFYHGIALEQAGITGGAMVAMEAVEGRARPVAERKLAELRAVQEEKDERIRQAREAIRKQAEARRIAAAAASYERRHKQYLKELAEYNRKMELWRADQARIKAEEKARVARRSSYYSTYSSNRSTYSGSAQNNSTRNPTQTRSNSNIGNWYNKWHEDFWRNHNNKMDNFYRTGQFNNYW